MLKFWSERRDSCISETTMWETWLLSSGSGDVSVTPNWGFRHSSSARTHHTLLHTRNPAVARESRPYFLRPKVCKCERNVLLIHVTRERKLPATKPRPQNITKEQFAMEIFGCIQFEEWGLQKRFNLIPQGWGQATLFASSASFPLRCTI